MRLLITLLIGLALGYIGHDYFPSLSGTSRDIKNVVAPQPVKSGEDSFLTVIEYKDGKFHPGSVSVRKGNYIALVNKSTSLMWLVSDEPKLNTVRGYGESEEVRYKAEKEGTYQVSNKLNLAAKAEVKIIP